MIDPELLAVLACPVTHLPLREATEAEIAAWNECVEAGSLRTVDGRPIEEPLEGALVREDGAVAYPVRDGIPVLLEEEGFTVPGAD